ncbi:MAG: energy-coupling factor transporter transmembrane component T [Candidatus Nanopelagicales bacterium]
MGDHRHGHDPGERLYVPGSSIVHRLPAHVKILAAIVTILAIVLTPPTAVWAFACYAVLLLVLVVTAGLPLRLLLPRMVIELPFVAFAVLLPFFGREPDIAVGPVSLSEPGLWAAWGIIAKATAGVLISLVLAATTPTRDLIDGLRRLRLPEILVQIVASMVRYVHVVTDEWTRMARAREARGFTVRGPGPGPCSRRAPEPSSSAPMNAASGSIWRCSAADTPDRRRRGSAVRSPRPSGSWPRSSPCWPPWWRRCRSRGSDDSGRRGPGPPPLLP